MKALIYILVGITYSVTFNGTMIERGYSSSNGLNIVANAIAWPVCLTYGLTKFLVNENYPTLSK